MRFSSRRVVLLIFDMACFVLLTAIYGLAAAIFPQEFTAGKLIINAIILFVCVFTSRLIFGIYNAVWRYMATHVNLKLIIADAIAGIVAWIIASIIGYTVGSEYFAAVGAFNALLALASRFTYRLLYKHKKISEGNARYAKKNIAIIGAGQQGALLANELAGNPRSGYAPVCFVDISKQKIGGRVAGLVVYSHEKFVQKMEQLDVTEVVIAITNKDNETLAKLNEQYVALGCKVNIYDTPFGSEPTSGERRVIREFQIEDLLFRSPMALLTDETRGYYFGKTVLVTGGGGSIGSELCRQIAKCEPRKLVILDIYENNAYNIQQELIRQYGDRLDLSVEIASVRDVKRLDQIFDLYRPNIVFHAAAHKHVPLMENSPAEAIKNNVLGTYNTANTAEKYGVEKFILISTDKAVNPTNIMGASKRLCEMVIQSRADSNTSFSAVRFGNVLGSNGSVIPLFKQQIANGGPVTITDKRIIRYFMTIPEAVQLVMTSGAMAGDGELFVLDMGKPVKIYDLAVNMIKLSGLVPDVDIEIKEIGLRPGEKLYEELLMKTELLDKTSNDMIFIEKDEPSTREELERKLSLLREAVERFENGEFDAVREAVRRTVSTYRDADYINKKAEQSEEMKMAK